jgi:hypothetical protein
MEEADDIFESPSIVFPTVTLPLDEGGFVQSFYVDQVLDSLFIADPSGR